MNGDLIDFFFGRTYGSLFYVLNPRKSSLSLRVIDMEIQRILADVGLMGILY